ncbi:MAG: hypothetical protein IKC10_01245 [Alphaproteobacteria bacterium]|nr:hypothetical protein [Alphaproteobacteria bacterium]
MLKTGLKAFVYSFSASLFTIIGVNRAFFHEKFQTPSSFDISNKSIALYLTDIKPSFMPVKKIALNTLPKLQEQTHSDTAPSTPDPEIIIASALEPSDIPLEFVDTQITGEKAKKSEPIFKKTEIELADVLYAPDKPLPMPEIKAEPIYLPKSNIEVKIASAPLYDPKKIDTISIPSSPSQVNTKDETKLTGSDEAEQLLIARSAPVEKIPLIQARTNNGINKVTVGKVEDLQHVAFADGNVPIASMTKDETKSTPKTSDYLKNSPWDIAKSTGSKNLFANKNYASKNDKEVAGLIPLEKGQKSVLLASETAKNLIIPIPEDILNNDDITPQLAYPLSSEDKKKEIDINAKIKELEAKEKTTTDDKKPKDLPVLAPIEDDVEQDVASLAVEPAKVEEQQDVVPATEKNGIINTLSSIFSKTAKTVSDATDKIIETAKSQNRTIKKRKSKNKENIILPTEIRLSFQPNRAEISGQTLRWIQAFGTKAAQTPGMTLELRIDGTTSTKLQQKRLNLVYNILTNKGVDYSMINTVFTSRDPNSFILRALNTKTKRQEINNQKANRYIQW